MRAEIFHEYQLELQKRQEQFVRELKNEKPYQAAFISYSGAGGHQTQ
jgi:hypothetical protein